MSDPSIESPELPSAADSEGVSTTGTLPIGRRTFIAGVAGAAAATAISGSVRAAGVPAGASYFESVGPLRVADTRTRAPYTNVAKGFRRIDSKTIQINIFSKLKELGVSSNGVVAVVLSIAAEYNGQRGWVKAVPAGTNSEVSNINLENGDSVVANMATVKVPQSGANAGWVEVKTHKGYDVVVDLSGAYRATGVPVRSGRMTFLPKVKRVAAGRRVNKGDTITVPISNVPASAQAVVVNLTAAYSRTTGFFAAFSADIPNDKRPNSSNLNWNVGDTRAAGAIVRLGRSGSTPAIKIYSHGSTDMYVDVTGYITGPTDAESEAGLFVPVNPYRVMDTRRAADTARSGKRRLWPNWTRPFELPTDSRLGFGSRSQMAGVAMNATLVSAIRLGFVTVLPAQGVRDEVSNLNVSRVGHIVANHVIARASTRGIECFAHCGGDMIADIAGWYVGSPQAPAYANPPIDPPPPPAPFNWTLRVPRMGLLNLVAPNTVSADAVVNTGNSWHWTNTGMIGDNGAAIVVFGHRTSYGGPYRYQHYLVGGDELVITTPDQREYRYTFVREALTDGNARNILNAARSNSSGTTFTLVACTGNGQTGALNDLPGGSTKWRLVSTFRLVSWRDTSPTVG